MTRGLAGVSTTSLERLRAGLAGGRLVLAERERDARPAPELVWTGPEGAQTTARDTAVILRDLFESARHRVILAGYSFRDATEVLGPLHPLVRLGLFLEAAEADRREVAPSGLQSSSQV